jgi:lysozyme
MNASELVTSRLKTEEGFRAKVYKDILGKQTIGYGFCVDAGITEFAAAALLTAQIQERDQALQQFWWYKGLDEVRKSVFIDVSFNVGVDGLLHFPKCIAAVGKQDWQEASAQLLDSDAARLLPHRYGPLADLLLNGG